MNIVCKAGRVPSAPMNLWPLIQISSLLNFLAHFLRLDPGGKSQSRIIKSRAGDSTIQVVEGLWKKPLRCH